MKSVKPLLYDRKIIDRVKLYLEQNVDQTNVNVARMTRDLMHKYPDYSRRKFGPFCKLVLEAFHIVSQSCGINQKVDSSTDLLLSQDQKEEVVFPKRNFMSGIMNALYNKPKVTEAQKSSIEQQPIAILSSDDESNDEPTTNGKVNEKIGPGVGAGGGGCSSGPHPDMVLITSKRPLPSGFGSPSVPAKKRRDSRRKTQEQRSMYNQQQSDDDSVSNISNGSQVRARKKGLRLKKPDHKFEEIGGMESTLKELCELLINIKSPERYFNLGLLPPRGILLHGPTGCGKTLLAEAIAGQLNLPLIEVCATELIAGISGESEDRIRDIFQQAEFHSPCIMFIDDVDTISSNRSLAQKDMDRRVVTQLIKSLDDLKNSDQGQSVLVIGATTRPDVIDPALRRFGRFDHEIHISVPSRKGRKDILMILGRTIGVDPNMDFDMIAELTPGFVGADLHALLTRAASIAVKRKCFQNFRNLEAKRLMTIVCLDDDETDPSPTKNSPKGVGDEKKNSEKIGDDSEIIVKSETCEKSEKCEKNETCEKNEKTDEVNKHQAETNENAGVNETDEETNENAPTKELDEESPMEEDMEVDGDGENINDKEEELKKKLNFEESLPEKGGDDFLPINDYEPTLLQLTNWLENPPDDYNEADFHIMLPDILAALKVFQPSAKREGFITVPGVTWDDIGSLQNIREELKLAVLAPVKYPEKLDKLGLTSPSGVLLCGPPGCGKTLLAKAIANEAGINFISVKGPELMNMYVGESERAVRACFQRARNSAPCVIFFDEFDSLCPKRSESNESGSGTRIVNQLLTEMDGVEDRKGVYILAATNRPDIIDPAILRPGRLDTILYVGLPELEDRVDILKANTKNGTRPLFAKDVDFKDLALKTDGYTGADLAGLVKHASMAALRESLKNPDQNLDDLCVRKEDFEQAINHIRPSVSAQDRKVYDKLRLKYAAPRDQIKNSDD